MNWNYSINDKGNEVTFERTDVPVFANEEQEAQFMRTAISRPQELVIKVSIKRPPYWLDVNVDVTLIENAGLHIGSLNPFVTLGQSWETANVIKNDTLTFFSISTFRIQQFLVHLGISAAQAEIAIKALGLGPSLMATASASAHSTATHVSKKPKLT